MIKKMDFCFKFFDENGKQIGSDYCGGTAYDVLGLQKSLNAIRIMLEEDIKGYE